MEAVSAPVLVRVQSVSHDGGERVDEWTHGRASGERSTGRPLVDRAFDNAERTNAWLASSFGRDGVDGRGGVLDVRVGVHDLETGQPAEVAEAIWWKRGHLELGYAGGRPEFSFGDSYDVMRHEATHLMRFSHAPWFGSDLMQLAADESLADVIVATTPGHSWTLAPELPGTASRNLTRPRWTTVAAMLRELESTQPGIAHLNDMSQLLSSAAVHASSSLGPSGPARIQDVWYHAMPALDALAPDPSFSRALSQGTIDTWHSVAGITTATALERHGATISASVEAGWRAIGLIPRL